MAQAIYIYEGAVIDYTPAEDVSAGDVIVQGELVGVAARDIKANTLGALAVAGVFDFAKATGSGTAINAGARVYWDNTAKVATITALNNTLIGKCVKAATTADTTVRVRMSQ